MNLSGWQIERYARKDFTLVSSRREYIAFLAEARLGPAKTLCVDLWFLSHPEKHGYNRATMNVYVVGVGGIRHLCSVHAALALAEGLRLLEGGLWAVETRHKEVFQDAILMHGIGPTLPPRGPYHADA